MIETNDETIVLSHGDGLWEAVHPSGAFGGPKAIRIAGDSLLEDARFNLDDVTDELAVVKKHRAYRKGGVGIVQSRGYLPFGAEAVLSQTCRYAGNHLRVAFDLELKRAAVVRRHLGMGSLFLPGEWRRYYCLPPSSAAIAGGGGTWHTVPMAAEGSGMIGHWHRPPLALVFERPDGSRMEVGTGTDIWRWEECLGYAPESGNFKVLLEERGIRLVREPLMCCEEFNPRPRTYRFTWYAAWSSPAPVARDDAHPAVPLTITPGDGLSSDLEFGTEARRHFVVDVSGIDWPRSWCRCLTPVDYVRGTRNQHPCWQAAGVQRTMKRAIRQLGGRCNGGTLEIRGLTPGLCCDPAHLTRQHTEGLRHWDMGALIDLAWWARRQLGTTWDIRATDTALPELPSLAGLFAANGFDAVVEKRSPGE